MSSRILCDYSGTQAIRHLEIQVDLWPYSRKLISKDDLMCQVIFFHKRKILRIRLEKILFKEGLPVVFFNNMSYGFDGAI